MAAVPSDGEADGAQLPAADVGDAGGLESPQAGPAGPPATSYASAAREARPPTELGLLLAISHARAAVTVVSSPSRSITSHAFVRRAFASSNNSAPCSRSMGRDFE